MFRLDRSAFRLCEGVCVCVCNGCLTIVVKFGISALGTKAERRTCKDLILFPYRFNMAAVLWAFYAVAGVERGLVFTQLLVSTVHFHHLKSAVDNTRLIWQILDLRRQVLTQRVQGSENLAHTRRHGGASRSDVQMEQLIEIDQ